MTESIKTTSFLKTAIKLGTQGPVKVLPTLRLVQLRFNGLIILKTTNAQYIWEHPYYPQFYLPKSELLSNSRHIPLQVHEGEALHSEDGTLIGNQWTIRVADRSIDKVVAFSDGLTGAAEPLRGLVKIDFASVDQWCVPLDSNIRKLQPSHSGI